MEISVDSIRGKHLKTKIAYKVHAKKPNMAHAKKPNLVHAKKSYRVLAVLALLVTLFFLPVLALAANTSASDTVGLVFVLVLYLVYCSCIIYQSDVYTAPLLLGATLRLGLLFYDLYTNDPLNLPMIGGELRSDPLGYFRAASQFAAGNPIRYGGFFSKFLGYIFMITGPSRIVGECVVAAFSIGTFHVVIHCLEELSLDDVKKRACMYLLCLAPNFALLSIVLRRETVVAFFVSLSLLFFIKWFIEGKGIDFTFSIVFSLAGSVFHGAVGILAVGYVICHLIYNPISYAFNLTLRNIAISMFFILLVGFLYANYADVLFTKIEEIDSIEDIADGVGRGNSTYAEYVGDSQTMSNFIIYSIPRMLYYMFSPFPWQWRGLTDILTFLMSSCVYAYILIKTIRSLKDPRTEPHLALIACLLIIIVLMVFVFGWGVSNVGTAARHRDKFISLFIVLYSLCPPKASDKAKKKML